MLRKFMHFQFRQLVLRFWIIPPSHESLCMRFEIKFFKKKNQLNDSKYILAYVFRSVIFNLDKTFFSKPNMYLKLRIEEFLLDFFHSC